MLWMTVSMYSFIGKVKFLDMSLRAIVAARESSGEVIR